MFIDKASKIYQTYVEVEINESQIYRNVFYVKYILQDWYLQSLFIQFN